MNLFNPDTSFYESYFDKAKYLLGWRISIVFILIFSIISIFYSFTSFTAAFPSYLVLIVGIFSLSYLYLTKNYKPIFWVYSISGFTISHFAMNTVFELTHYIDFLWVMICIFLTFIGLGRKVGIIFTIINAFLIAYFFWFTLNYHILTLKPRTNTQLIGEYLEVLFALFILGYLIHQYFLFQQYSEKELIAANQGLETQNQLITAKNNENILLMKEVHHRVKNNLQIIISLLRLQKGNLAPEIQQKFDESINRIMTMSLIHSKLYQSNDFSKINIKSYIEDLINEILFSLSIDDNINTNIVSNVDTIGLKTIVPLGLILNELLSNSFKHAFKENESGEIAIEINKINNHEFELNYYDSGKWLDVTTAKRVKFGLELIETLTEQLDGTMSRKDSKYNFKLKNIDI
ncbi:MAG: sensor histidine kinase [Flavobacteriales bacterium]|nr:sensor histidine kinase [Flavobacteriales bacterium]